MTDKQLIERIKKQHIENDLLWMESHCVCIVNRHKSKWYTYSVFHRRGGGSTHSAEPTLAKAIRACSKTAKEYQKEWTNRYNMKNLALELTSKL